MPRQQQGTRGSMCGVPVSRGCLHIAWHIREPKDIAPDKAMSSDPGKSSLKAAVLQGPPGAGKTSFIRHYAYKWSEPTEGEDTKEQKKWNLIVILPVSTLRISKNISTKEQIHQAIRQSLYGSEVEAIMEHLDDKNFRVLIIPDGLDECRSDTTLDMLKKLVEQSHTNILPYAVFATCRSGLCPIKQSEFERWMKIEGFTIHQGMQYVNTFYLRIMKPKDESLEQYICNCKENLDHILTNPFRTHVLCVVTADGTLKLTQRQYLKIKQLLKAMEESSKRRQLEKGKKSAENPEKYLEELGDIEEQTKTFYMLCLYSLLEDIRTFGETLLHKFSILSTNPYFAFMRRKQTYNERFEKVMEWHFTHEMWHEYLASCAIPHLPEDTLQYFLLHLCSRKEFRNTQRILFSTLGEDEDYFDKLSDMVKGTLLLQGVNSEGRPWLHDMKKKVDSLKQGHDPLKVLLTGGQHKLQKETVLVTQSIWNDIVSCFKGNPTMLEKNRRFRCILFGDNIIPHIYSCLQEIPQESSQRIFNDSFAFALPCSE